MSCSGTIWILFMGTLECARVVEVLFRLTDGSIPGQLLKQGLDWDWTGTGLELDWSNLANNCRLMQARAYSDEN